MTTEKKPITAEDIDRMPFEELYEYALKCRALMSVFEGLGAVTLGPGEKVALHDVMNRNLYATALMLDLDDETKERAWVLVESVVFAGLPLHVGNHETPARLFGPPGVALNRHPLMVGQGVQVNLHNIGPEPVTVSGGIQCDEVNPMALNVVLTSAGRLTTTEFGVLFTDRTILRDVCKFMLETGNVLEENSRHITVENHFLGLGAVQVRPYTTAKLEATVPAEYVSGLVKALVLDANLHGGVYVTNVLLDDKEQLTAEVPVDQFDGQDQLTEVPIGQFASDALDPRAVRGPITQRVQVFLRNDGGNEIMVAGAVVVDWQLAPVATPVQEAGVEPEVIDVYEAAKANGGIKQNQFNGLGTALIRRGSFGALTDQVNYNMWPTRLILDLRDRQQPCADLLVVGIRYGGTPLDLAQVRVPLADEPLIALVLDDPNFPTGYTGIPVARFVEQEGAGLLLPRQWLMAGQRVEVVVRHVARGESPESFEITGAMICDVMDPYVMQRWMEETLLAAAAQGYADLEPDRAAFHLDLAGVQVEPEYTNTDFELNAVAGYKARLLTALTEQGVLTDDVRRVLDEASGIK